MSRRMSDENKEFEARRRFKGMKFEMAPQDRVEDYKYELEDILEVLGHPEALITDLSSISDFYPLDRKETAECMERISRAFGIEVAKPNELLVDLAKRVRKARKDRD